MSDSNTTLVDWDELRPGDYAMFDFEGEATASGPVVSTNLTLGWVTIAFGNIEVSVPRTAFTAARREVQMRIGDGVARETDTGVVTEVDGTVTVKWDHGLVEDGVDVETLTKTSELLDVSNMLMLQTDDKVLKSAAPGTGVTVRRPVK